MRIGNITGLVLLLLLPVDLAASLDESVFLQYENRTITGIRVTGNRITREYILRRELELRPGQIFTLATLEEDIRRLENLGIFSSIDVIALPDETGVSLEFQVRELKAYIPYLTLKYTENDGLSLGPALSVVNLLGRDIYFSAYLVFGGTRHLYLKFEDPWITGDHLSFGFRAAHLERDDNLNDFGESSTEFTPQVGLYIGRTGRASARFSFFRMRSDVEGHTLSSDNVDNLFRVGASISLDTRDSRQNPHRGWKNQLEVSKTGGFLGGDGDFLTTDIDIRRFQPTSDRQVLALGGLLSLRTGTVGVHVPEYLQYRMGGANTIRGYNINELGKTLFGKNQLILTAEYRFLLMEPKEIPLYKWPTQVGVQTVFFIDSGITWNYSNEFSTARARTGFGAGVRLLLPRFDMLRLDVGISTSGEIQFHFGARSNFDARRNRLR